MQRNFFLIGRKMYAFRINYNYYLNKYINIYRKKLLEVYIQLQGQNMKPTLSWMRLVTDECYECLDGLYSKLYNTQTKHILRSCFRVFQYSLNIANSYGDRDLKFGMEMQMALKVMVYCGLCPREGQVCTSTTLLVLGPWCSKF